MKFKTINLLGLKISFRNFKEASRIFGSIFIGKEYHFKSNKKNPFILDCGSHIGLSVLYFKKIYPKSKIIAFEPNPDTFKLLKRNVEQNKLKNVKLINAALSDKRGEAFLYVDKKEKSPWSWGDAIVRNKWNTSNNKGVKVKTVKLSEFLDKDIDFLKLDIEGAETRIFKEIKPKFSKVKELIMEFHGSSTNKENNLEEVLKILEENNFKYTIKQGGKFLKAHEINREDPFWLIIHAKRV
ncbi:MAG: FkbM family methyltransferase [Patescibacteria group bacterium]